MQQKHTSQAIKLNEHLHREPQPPHKVKVKFTCLYFYAFLISLIIKLPLHCHCHAIYYYVTLFRAYLSRIERTLSISDFAAASVTTAQSINRASWGEMNFKSAAAVSARSACIIIALHHLNGARLTKCLHARCIITAASFGSILCVCLKKINFYKSAVFVLSVGRGKRAVNWSQLSVSCLSFRRFWARRLFNCFQRSLVHFDFVAAAVAILHKSSV